MKKILTGIIAAIVLLALVPSYGQTVMPLINATTINYALPGVTFDSVTKSIQANVGTTDTMEGGTLDQLAFFKTYWGARVSATDTSGTDMFSQYSNRLRYAVAARMEGTAMCGGGWQGNWQPFGPDSMPTYHGIGKINAIWADPNDTSFILAGSSGGLFRSTDYGTDWTCISDKALLVGGRMGVSSIAVNPLNRNNIYISTGVIEENGTNMAASFLKTEDGGESWQQMIIPVCHCYTDTNAFVQKVIITPDSSRLYVFLVGDVYTATTSGGSWTKITPPGGPFIMFKEFQFDPANQNHFFLTSLLIGTGIFESNVAVPSSPGDWTEISHSLPLVVIAGDTLDDSNYKCLSISVPNADTLYAVGMGPYYEQVLFKYDIAVSHTWSRWATYIPDAYQSWLNKSNLIVSPSNPAVIYYGGSTASVSLDYGNSFSQVCPYGGNAASHSDIRDMCLQQSTNTTNGIGDRLYLANDGGVTMKPPGNVITALGCNTFVNVNGNGLDCGEFNGFGMSYDGRLMVGGMQHDGMVSYEQTEDTAWIDVNNNGDAGNAKYDAANISGISFLNGGPENFLTTGSRDLGTCGPALVPPYDGPVGLSEALYINSSGTQYLGWHHLWRLNHGASSWLDMNHPWPIGYGLSNPDSAYIESFTFSPYDTELTGYVLYYAVAGGQYLEYRNPAVLPNFQVSSGMLGSLPGNVMTCVAMDAVNPQNVWVGMGGSGTNTLQAQYSPDAGSTWYNVSYGLPQYMPVTNIIHQEGSNVVFAATDVGIYRCDFSSFDPSATNYGVQWTCFNDCAIAGNGFPNVAVTDMQINYCQGKLYAATYGRSIWSTDLNPPGTVVGNTTVISANTTWSGGNQYMTGSIDVQAGAIFTISNSDTVHMPKGGVISVEPGGQLIVSNSEITNDCSQCFWQGIEARGQVSLPQSPTSNQGWVTIKNGSTIQHAITGVRNSNANVVWGQNGGIIQANGSYFVDNISDVDFDGYDNWIGTTLYPNRSNFVLCTFQLDNNFKGNTMGMPMQNMVNLHSVEGLNFEGCQFINRDTFAINRLIGEGIDAVNSDFRVGAACPPGLPSYACLTPTVRSRFCGFTNGIAIHGIYQPGLAPSIDNADFDSVSVGVNVATFNNVTTTRCNFVVGHGLSVADVSSPVFTGCYQNIGLLLQNSVQFKEEGNTFTGKPNITYSNWYNFGTVVANSGAFTNTIYRNTFDSLTEGVFTIGINNDNDMAYPMGKGLKVLCNAFSGNSNDVFVNNSGMPLASYGGIAATQGTYLPPSGPYQPAGNTFSGSAINICNSGIDINYYYHTGVVPEDPLLLCVPAIPAPSGTVIVHGQDATNTCAATIGILPYTGGAIVSSLDLLHHKQAFYTNRTAYQDSLAVYNGLTDFGNTDSLLTIISRSSDTTALFSTLASGSPYISVAALETTGHLAKLPYYSMLQLLQQNPDDLNKNNLLAVMQTDYSFSTADYDTLLSAAQNVTSRTKLEAAMSGWQDGMAAEATLILTALKTPVDTDMAVTAGGTWSGICTDSNSVYFLLDSNACYLGFDSVDVWLQNTGELWASYDRAGYYNFLNQPTKADSIFNGIGANLTAGWQPDSAAFITMGKVWSATKGIGPKGDNLYNLDSAGIAGLDTSSAFLWSYNPGLVMTQSITELYSHTEIVTAPCLHVFGEVGRMGHGATDAPPISGPGQYNANDHFAAYPNPTNGMVTFAYNVPDATGAIKITVTNIVGETVKTLSAANKAGSLYWDTKGLPAGVYLYQAVSDKGIISMGKLVVTP